MIQILEKLRSICGLLSTTELAVITVYGRRTNTLLPLVITEMIPVGYRAFKLSFEFEF